MGDFMARPGVMLYFDILPSLDMLTTEECGTLFKAILEYGKYGVVPQLGGMVALAWTFIQPSLDRDSKKYEKRIKDAKIKGITSDFKKNYAPKHGIDPEDQEELEAYIMRKLRSTTVDSGQPSTFPTTTPTTAPIASTESNATERGAGGNRSPYLDPDSPEAKKFAAIEMLRGYQK